MEGPAQNYLPDQHLMSREIKIKGSPLSRDLDQVEVTTEKVEGTTVKTTESSNQDRSKAEHPFRQPHRTTLTKTTVGWKEVPNQNIEKLGCTIDSPILQADLLQYDYLTSSSRPTTLNMMAIPKPRQWLRIYSQSIELTGGNDDIKTLFFPMALETMPLQWFDKLNPGSIRNWEDLQRVFVKILQVSLCTQSPTQN